MSDRVWKLSDVLYQVSSTNSERGRVLLHWCPGCKCPHAISLTKPDAMGRKYKFDGEVYSPTFKPDIYILALCHYELRKGFISFEMDCIHDLAGKTVAMAPFDFG